ncbi:MAG: aminopeptidase N [Desulfuromonadaceae bacterium]|nr:aminopeptidase N [Desulfuromonadaceae bacterium]
MTTAPATIYLKDYTPPAYLIDSVALHFELDEAATIVRSRLSVRRNPAGPGGALVLFGRQLTLRELLIDEVAVPEERFTVDAETLRIDAVPEQFVLRVTTEINPGGNTSLEGLYTSNGKFCTQCEAQGFRKITYYPDRPDVSARFTVTIDADRDKYPILLSNGNPVASSDLGDGRQRVVWEDPFPKPSYLFALVAGALVCIEDRFITCSGREVALRLYVEERNQDKCAHAMRALQHAMQWDEETYGLEYDLDIYMIVAVDDFNMGAMENKGLNVFNSKYVLARPETATDADFVAIEEVIGHEYFHNWTGNRVTCRDWFQLSLKEGLTVFRDQEFTADMTSRAVKRIDDVQTLRNGQFPEDSGPMAHPVRPASYEEINNFYTATIYNKGAEVIRMYQTLFGRDGFRAGLCHYLAKHDGAAATIEDFLRAMATTNHADLGQFERWYDQAGTPTVQVQSRYDAAQQTFSLTLRQELPPTPGQPQKLAQLIPVAVGLLGGDGTDLPLQLADEASPAAATTRVLRLTEMEQTFTFVAVPERPVASVLRGFSAPVKLAINEAEGDLAFRLAHDSDSFNRWEAGQQLANRILLRLVAAATAGKPLVLEPLLIEAFGQVLADQTTDPALVARALALPTETWLAEQQEVVDPGAIHAARTFVRRELARALRPTLRQRYLELTDNGPFTLDAAAIGRRALRNICLAYLMVLEEDEGVTLAQQQFTDSDNMTDVLAALGALAHAARPEREEALAAFYFRWQNDPLVVDKWFALQATAPGDATLGNVIELLSHPAFTIKNPNKVRALIGTFCAANPAAFHAADGSGYRFAADQVLAVDPLNPQVAARLAGCLSRWQRYDEDRRALMKAQLERIAAVAELSRDVREIVSKSLTDCVAGETQ